MATYNIHQSFECCILVLYNIYSMECMFVWIISYRTRHVDHDSDDLDPDSLLDDHDPDSFDEHSSFSGMITTDAMHLTGWVVLSILTC